MKEKTSRTDYIFLAIFGIGAIAIFAAELVFSDPQPTQRETVLYNALELGLSLGFGWILQRIDSRKQFQESLKQFALSAYRRITDIEKSVNRIRGEINKMRLTYAQDKVHELDILRMVAEEMENTVNSSISDWTDVIGEEIYKKERIRELQIEQQSLIARNATLESEKIKEIKDEIDRLRAELPALMRLDTQPNDLSSTQLVATYFVTTVESLACINLKIISPTGQSNEYFEKNQPYFLRIEKRSRDSYVSAVNKSGESIGDIENPFKGMGVSDKIFFDTLASLIFETHRLSNMDKYNNEEPSISLLTVEAQYTGISLVYPYEFFIKVPIDSRLAFQG